MWIRSVLLVFLMLFAVQTTIADELTAEKRKDIARLIALTGGSKIATQMAGATSQQMLKTLKAAQPDIPDRALEVVQEEVMRLFAENVETPGGLIDIMTQIYAKYFTHQEIVETIAFYETPLGRKTISVMPDIFQESMLAGQQWGQSLAPQIKDRLLAALQREGLIPKEEPEAPETPEKPN